MLEKQKAQAGEAFVSTVLFDDESSVLHDRVDIQKVASMTHRDYFVGGCTALLDAIGGAIHHIGNVHKYARREDVPKHTIFVITTDGMENASHTYSSARVKEMIKRQTEKYGWEFIFVAANIDAINTAENIGIRRDRAANYRQTKEGVSRSYYAMSEAITCIRTDSADKMNIEEYLEEEES